ncbi:MAG: hypothetical protein KAJ81_02460, partial [Candidatus Latescibacteria bacterium]|nr:hypothetical protein [Candidatus Latescibacterota bacterium]
EGRMASVGAGGTPATHIGWLRALVVGAKGLIPEEFSNYRDFGFASIYSIEFGTHCTILGV